MERGPASDMAYDILRALLEPMRPGRGRAVNMTGAGGWEELTVPQGHGLTKLMPYCISARGTYADDVLVVFSMAYAGQPFSPTGGRTPSPQDIAEAFILPLGTTMYLRSWPEDEGVRVFVGPADPAAAGIASCRIHGMAPGSTI